MSRFFIGFGNVISGFGFLIAAGALILIVVINGANVVARYVFYSPFSWAEEAMLFIMIAGVFWGSVAVAWRQVDIRIDAFINLATGRLHRTLRVIASLLSMTIVFSLFLVSSRVASQLFGFDQRSDALHLPMWLPHSAFAAGLLLIVLMMVVRLFMPAASANAHAPDQGD